MRIFASMLPLQIKKRSLLNEVTISSVISVSMVVPLLQQKFAFYYLSLGYWLRSMHKNGAVTVVMIPVYTIHALSQAKQFHPPQQVRNAYIGYYGIVTKKC